MPADGLPPKKSVDDVWPVTGKRVLVRADFNVPLRSGVIDNDYLIRTAIPTIRRIIDQGGICVLLSDLGNPRGVDSETVDAQLRQQQPHFQENRGKTNFFSNLSGEDKATILSWSTKREKAASLPAQQGGGKTAVFRRLAEEEKKNLLTRFLNENKERLFPQLTSSAGFDEDYSLQIVAVRLAELLGQHVYFAHDCLFAKNEIMKLRGGEVMLLENVRFYTDECSPDEAKRLKMAAILASYGDIFVNDAFGVAHMDSASITGIPRVLGQGAAGYLMDRELSYFSKVLYSPARPLTALVGGAKVSDKLFLLQHLLCHVDSLLVGGGLAFTLLKAKGHNIGASLFEPDCLEAAAAFLQAAKEQNVRVYLPLDHVCSVDGGHGNDRLHLTSTEDIPDGLVALDIGPQTVKKYVSVIGRSKSVIWNGPMGKFEVSCFAKGTFAIARAMADLTQKRGLLSIIGGGDSACAAERSGAASRMSHVSTGGAASFSILEGRTLPAVAVLDNK